jgi:hypothetical protein
LQQRCAGGQRDHQQRARGRDAPRDLTSGFRHEARIMPESPSAANVSTR